MPSDDDHPQVTVELERGRAAFERQAWAEAREALGAADNAGPVEPSDLRLLATSAYMIGREAEFQGVLARAHSAYLDAGDTPAALLCAFWIGATLAQKGDMGRAGGWIGRAQRLLETEGEEDWAERAYLLIPRAFAQAAAGEPEAAAAIAADAVAIGQHSGDGDLFALAAQLRGTMLVRAGHLNEGLSMLDEAMVAVTAGETSPIASGIVYCGVILTCRDAHDIGRAREWTAALSEWCERQPDLVAFTGRCRVHRAEIMQLRGAWSEALDEAQRARERALAGENPGAASEARYRQGEIHRLRGDFAAAEEAYREASREGWEPQPGLALMRLAQGQVAVAEAAIDRSLAERHEPAARLTVLPAAVDIKIATGALEEAREACGELAEITEDDATPMLEAVLAGCQGAVELAAGDAPAALARLRRAWELWRDLEATYEGARVRVLVGSACRALGDEEAASLELDAARADFERLGAQPDLDRIGSLSGEGTKTADHSLTGRELEVLRLVAAGNSNRDIAAELVISEHTVARHLQNIFAKLGVSSRTAASAYAFERDLL